MMSRFTAILSVFALFIAFQVVNLQQAHAVSELKFTSAIMLTQASITEARIPMFKKWMAESGDKLVIEFYNANTIVNSKELLPAVERGAIDITILAPSLTPNVFPISSMYELPFMFQSIHEGVYAFTKLLKNNPEAAAEYDKFKVLAFTGSVPMDLVSLKPISTLADLKGKRVGVMQAQAVEISKQLGMIPILLTLSDFYLSLQRGVIDCTLAPIPTYRSTKVCEVGKYITRLSVSMSAAPTVMNKKVYASLAPEIQTIIDKYCPDAFNVMGTQVIAHSAVKDLAWLIENNGVQVIDLPADEIAQLPELVAPTYVAWENLAKKYGVKDPMAIMKELQGYAQEFRNPETLKAFEAQYIPVLGDLYKKY